MKEKFSDWALSCRAFISGLALLWLLPGCASTPPSTFYVLHPSHGASPISGQNETPSLKVLDNVLIGAGPVKLPDYLDRAQVVTRSGETTVQIHEFQRWAEPLEKSFARVVVRNFTHLLSTNNILSYPWPGARDVDYQVVIEVTRFDGALGGRAFLDAVWTVQSDRGKQVWVRRSSRLAEPTAGPSCDALVSAMSRAVERLCSEIALALVEASRSPRTKAAEK